jgi:hypothetical protein
MTGLTVALLLSGCGQPVEDRDGQSEDRTKLACVVSAGRYSVHFSAYQEPTAEELKDRKKAYSPHCQDLPRTGKAYLTVDMLDADVKSTPIGVKVMTKGEGGGRNITTVPAAVYKNGIIEVVSDLPEPGEYTVELGVEHTGAKADTVRIPLRVALQPKLSDRVPQIAVAVGGLVAMMVALFAFLKRKQTKA